MSSIASMPLSNERDEVLSQAEDDFTEAGAAEAYASEDENIFENYWTRADDRCKGYHDSLSDFEEHEYSTAAKIPTEGLGARLDPYEYAALPGRHIRLLILYPGRPQDDLCGTFVSSPIDEGAYYKALSYTWGMPEFSDTLFLPEGTIRITPSLAGALRRFRQGTKYVRIWADAVCINQSDVQERNRQVSMMAEIYSNAEMVLIWLGDADAEDAQRFDTIRFLAACWREYNDYIYSGHDLPSLSGPYEQYFSPRKSPTLEDRLADLLPIFTRPYFGRLWVYQECALAQRAYVFCGRHLMDHELFSGAASIAVPQARRRIETRVTIARSWELLIAASYSVTHVLGSSRLVRSLQESEYPLSSEMKLVRAVLHSCELACSDPRDRIFALLSVIPGAGLETNYDLRMDSLWRQFTVRALTQPKSWVSHLEKLSDYGSPSTLMAIGAAAQDLSIDQNRMSWVADLCTSPLRIRTTTDRYTHTSDLYAGGHMIPRYTPHVLSSGALRMRGTILSHVSVLQHCSQWPGTPRPWEEAFENFVISTLLPWYLRCRSFLEQYGGNVLSNSETRSIIQQGSLFNRINRLTLHEFKALYTKTRGTTGQALDWAEAYYHLDSMLNRTYWNHDWIDRGRLLATDSSGRFCWVPERSKSDDCIVLLEGTPFPWVLRRAEGGCYEVLGDAYVSGVMRGEMWPLSPFFGLASKDGDRLEILLEGVCDALREMGTDPSRPGFFGSANSGSESCSRTSEPETEAGESETFQGDVPRPSKEERQRRWEEYYNSFGRLNEERGHLLEEIHLV